MSLLNQFLNFPSLDEWFLSMEMKIYEKRFMRITESFIVLKGNLLRLLPFVMAQGFWEMYCNRRRNLIWQKIFIEHSNIEADVLLRVLCDDPPVDAIEESGGVIVSYEEDREPVSVAQVPGHHT